MLAGLIMGAYLTVAPDSPSAVNATGERMSIVLAWSPPAYDGDGAILGYEVYRSDRADGVYSLIASIPGLSYNDTSVLGGMSYWYKLRAVNSAGESALSLSVEATTIAAADGLQTAAAIVISSGVAVAGAAVASQALGGASGAAPGSFALWWQKFLLLIKKVMDFLYGFGEDKAVDYVFKNVNKVEPEKGHPVSRASFLAAYSRREVGTVAFASVVLGLTFLIAKRMEVLNLWNLAIFIIVAGFALTLHDLAHRYMAWKHNVTSEYQVWWLGSIIMFITSVAFYTVYASPSRFRLDKQADLSSKERALIHGMGPLTSFIVFLAFALLVTSDGSVMKIGILACSINLLIATYGMMPFDPMDGKKVYEWNRWVWLVTFIPLIMLYFALAVYVF
jgi:Zn-dependent protease